MVELVCGLEQRKKLEAIPLSNDVIQSRIVEISCNILKQIINELKASPFPFSMQLDETTDISNCSQLLLFVRYVSADTIKEEFLFCEPLLQTTKAVDVLAILNVFFSKHDFDWKQKLHSLCTDGAPAMLGNKSGFAHLVKKEAPNVIVTHCFLHRHALATKTLPTSLIDVLSIVIKTVNFIRSRALNHRLFKTLCQEMNAEHEGPDTTIMDATEKLQAFLSKMSVWKIRIQNGIYANFQMLDEFIFENGSRQDSLLLNNLKDEICEHLEILQVSFEKYFNLDEITKKDELWIRNPFLCDIDCIDDMDLAKDEFRRKMDLDLLQDTERLENMSDTLNLEENANKYISSSASHIAYLLEDYEKLKKYVQLQKKICCSYGIDSALFPNYILKRMKDLLFHFGSHESTFYVFCYLKSELCIEQEEFFDDIIRRVEKRLESSSNIEEHARLIKACLKIRKMYPIFQN
ncbi:protein ZBED8 [Nephila pilipes]|uniref:Protein ZBED8 n=1 Tax=Nephila pilipes TaxID=299642 RepID=A0A8X6K7I1_NEPPI|nr:protein ZBED8 [Nephila pilipes]